MAEPGDYTLLARATSAGGQTQPAASGTTRIPQFENDQVKVWKSVIVPNGPLTLHRHEHGRTIVALVGGDLKIVKESGQTTVAHWETGKAYWLPADRPGDVEIHFGSEIAPKGFAWAVPVVRGTDTFVRVGVMTSRDPLGGYSRMLARVALAELHELGRADGSEVGRMREQHHPLALCGVVANSDHSMGRFPVNFGSRLIDPGNTANGRLCTHKSPYSS